jgi:hypothetical protein
VATQKLKTIKPPDTPIKSFPDLNDVIRQATKHAHVNQRNEATRKRRKDKVDKEFDDRREATSEVLEPLLDAIFSYTVEHWTELASENAPGTVDLDSATFKRYIDHKGTQEINEKVVIDYIQKIEETDMVATLRKIMGDSVVDELISRLQALVTTVTVTVTELDSGTLKEIVKEQPFLTILGFNIAYNHKVTLHYKQSSAEKRDKKAGLTEVREWPAT